MIKIYRVKDMTTGKYLTTGRYSYSGISFTKRGRYYTQLGYIQLSLRDRGADFVKYYKRIVEPTYHEDYQENNWKSRKYNADVREAAKEFPDFLPDDLVVVDEQETIMMSLKQLLNEGR